MTSKSWSGTASGCLALPVAKQMRRLSVNKMGAARQAVVTPALLLLGIIFVHREIWQLRAATFHLDQLQEILLLPLAVIDGAIAGAFSSSSFSDMEPSYKKHLRWASPAFFVLYVACAALCERLSVLPIRADFVRWCGLVLVVAGVAVRAWSRLMIPSLLRLSSGSSPLIAPDEKAHDLPAERLSPESKPPGSAGIQPVSDEPPECDTGSPSGVSSRTNLVCRGPHRLVRHPEAAGALLAFLGLPLAFGCWLPLLALPGIVVLLKWHISDKEAFLISQLGEPYLQYRKESWNLIPFIY